MKATLIIPSPRAVRKYPLATPARPHSSRSLRILGATFARVLNGVLFRDLRDVLGARIETDDVAAVAALLKLSENEPGLVRK
jgi:hypothetical protein